MKKVTVVLGLGISGRAAAEFLLMQQASVLGIDGDLSLIRSSDAIRRLQAMGLSVQHDSDPIDWSQVEQLVVSPGVSQMHPAYLKATEAGIPVTGEAELALCHFQKPLVAITGTNGKTTVTLLVEHVLNFAGIKAQALGNVGTPLCSHLICPGDAQAFVVELSSYQLETMRTPVFDAAVLLNITPDHLDRYSGMLEYAEAKCRLQHLMKQDAPFYVQAQAAAAFGQLLTDGKYQILEKVECLLPLDYRQAGRHDRENVLAAWALCRFFAVPHELFCRALATFRKPAHRIEFVREIDGVSYFDDSKGTNIDAVVQAVKAMKGDVILIVGGVDKGASYLYWKEHFSGRVKKLIAIGSAAPRIYSELHPHFDIQLADSLHLAVQIAAADAQRGDCVLLSPGCSSFDMFRDYAHRGEVFQQAVHSLYRT